jgi:hypothetical protein
MQRKPGRVGVSAAVFAAIVAELLVMFVAAPARAQSESAQPAQPDAEDPPPPGRFPSRPAFTPPAKPEWYGGTVAIVDGASYLSMVLLPPAGLAGIALGAPVVHASHGRWGMAAGSLALRSGALLTAVVIAGMPSDECEHNEPTCDPTGRYVQALVPLLAVQVADVMFFSWTTPETEQAALPAVLPSIALTPGGGALGLSGRF